jgi:hypothetical protein
MQMRKGRGYAWGFSSVIFDVGYLVLPFVLIKPSSSAALETLVLCIQILWACFPFVAYILAFVGRTRSEGGTKARRLCNIGATIGWIFSIMLMFMAFGSLWMDVFSLSAAEAEVTTFVDTFLIAGYFLVAYISGKILWFLK